MRRRTALALSVGAGLLLAASLPPWGWWPAAFPGIVLVDRLVVGTRARGRLLRGVVIGLALLGPSMIWIVDLSAPGYVVAVLFFAVLLGAGLAACPPGAGRPVGLIGAWVLVEAFRGAWPFGGVPLSTLAVGQVAGPLAPVARLGGTLLLSAVTVGLGLGFAALVGRRVVAGVALLAVAALVTGGATIAPKGEATTRRLRIAIVQGGGPQGTRADETNPRDVFDRHLAASQDVPAGVDLTVWPEDVVDTATTVTDAVEGTELAGLAKQLRSTLIAGVVEDEGEDQFHNAAVAWDAKGKVVDRYEKVHRVPFGEYVPLRSLIEPFAGGTLPGREAVVGRGPATLTIPNPDASAGGDPTIKLGVVISWEVFFGHRARDAVLHGGEVVLNPTNGSSYRGTFVQSQQIASSRLRAIETGRWVVQVAPTGFSAFVSPTGRVEQRTGVSEQAVRVRPVVLRTGLTAYTRLGDHPFILLGLVLLAAGWAVERRSDRRSLNS